MDLQLRFVELYSRFVAWLSRSVWTARRRIQILTYYSFIWDALRRGYIESRREEFKRFYSSELVTIRKSRRHAKPDIDTLALSRMASLRGREYVQRMRPYHSIDRFGIDIEQSNDFKHCNYIREGEEFACPLPEMPKFARNYQLLSTVYAIVAIIKYGFLSSITYGWLDVDPVYTCYLPGRLGLPVEIPNSMPWIGFLVFGFHLLWRLTWYFGTKRLDCDCLLFLYYDKETLLDKQFELARLNDPNLAPEVAYKLYLCNKILVEQQIDADGRVSYAMKKHRTIEHYETLTNVTVRKQFRSYSYMATMWLPILIWGAYTLTTHEYFDKSYPSCRSFSSRYTNNDDFTWSFEDKFRLIYLLYDGLENAMFALETMSGLMFPWSTGTILTEDLHMRLQRLCDKVTQLNTKLRTIVLKGHRAGHEMGVPLKMRFIEDIEGQSELIFKETVDTFKQVQEVDGYVSLLSQYTLFCCFSVELSFQVIILSRMNVIKESPLMYYFMYSQIASLSLLYYCFLVTIRPYNQTQILYKRLCSAMALYPIIPKTKISWLWLLEYYHKSSTRCTLHLIGKALELSNLNFLRCMSWFGTCILIIISLWMQKSAAH